MRQTFPVRGFPWMMYAGPVLIVGIAVVTTIVVYDSLPATLATTWDFQNNPTGFMQKTNYVAAVLGYMIGMAVLFMALDRFMVYRLFPVPLMSAIGGAMELFCLLVHLSIINVGLPPDLTILQTIIVLFAAPCAYVYVHMKLFRGTMGDMPAGIPLWIDKPPQSFLTTVFFFVRPILPREIIAYNEGLVLHAATYHFMIPWGQIRSLKHATTSKAMMGMGVRLASSPSRSVELRLVEGRLPLIFSIDNEARLIAEWEKRRV
ncbi:MAG: DUF1648 domain-containing protein [Deltaproteobacteria bacterium]|nr:DUF1648 domain-containing protein [Deltaproteobacteria bacterium]